MLKLTTHLINGIQVVVERNYKKVKLFGFILKREKFDVYVNTLMKKSQ